MKVYLQQFTQVSTHNLKKEQRIYALPINHSSQILPVKGTHLVSVDKYDLLDGQRKQNVQEENLVAPDDPLFLSLCVEPSWPLVLHQLVLKPVVPCHVGDKVLWGHNYDRIA